MTLTAFPNMIFRAQNMPRITCMTCGEVMLLDLCESVSDGFEIRSFSCIACDIVERFVTEL